MLSGRPSRDCQRSERRSSVLRSVQCCDHPASVCQYVVVVRVVARPPCFLFVPLTSLFPLNQTTFRSGAARPLAAPSGACTNCPANSLTSTCSNCFYCLASGSLAWNSGTLAWYIPSQNWRSSWGSQCATQSTGCCPASRVVDGRVCCPDSSWLGVVGATSWVSGFASGGTSPLTKYNTDWFPRGCCPNTFVQNSMRCRFFCLRLRWRTSLRSFSLPPSNR